MTMNGALALTLFGITIGTLALGSGFVHQARGRWLQWPSPALLALGGPFLLIGLVFGQIVLFRITDLPWPFGVNDPGTLLVRLAALIVVWALVYRVFSGHLLTTTDRARIREGPET